MQAQPFRWTDKRKAAVPLLARGDGQEDVARALGIDDATLWRWRQVQEFTAAVEAEGERIRAAIRAEGISRKQNRIDRLNADWNRLQQVIEERATDPTLAYVPGGTTGLIVRSYKQVGAGKDAQLVEEFGVDVATLKELRAHEQQAAQELGQWDEDKADAAVSGGPPVRVTIINAVNTGTTEPPRTGLAALWGSGAALPEGRP